MNTGYLEEQKKLIIQNAMNEQIISKIEKCDSLYNRYSIEKILKYAQYRNPINGPTMIFKKSSAIEIGGFPEVGSNEDYCFVGKFIVNGLILANINKSLVKFRAGNELVSRRMGKRYILGEQEALLYLYKIGLFNKTVYLFHYYGKKIIRNLPHKFNSILYTKFLRTN